MFFFKNANQNNTPLRTASKTQEIVGSCSISGMHISSDIIVAEKVQNQQCFVLQQVANMFHIARDINPKNTPSVKDIEEITKCFVEKYPCTADEKEDAKGNSNISLCNSKSCLKQLYLSYYQTIYGKHGPKIHYLELPTWSHWQNVASAISKVP